MADASKVTPACKHALKTLIEGGGEGVVDNMGRALIAGVRTKFDASTWLRLFTLGCLEPAGPFRFRVTEHGRREAS